MQAFEQGNWKNLRENVSIAATISYSNCQNENDSTAVYVSIIVTANTETFRLGIRFRRLTLRSTTRYCLRIYPSILINSITAAFQNSTLIPIVELQSLRYFPDVRTLPFSFYRKCNR